MTRIKNHSFYTQEFTEYELQEEALRLKGEKLIGKRVLSKTFVHLAYRNKIAISDRKEKVLGFHLDTNGKEPLLILHFRERQEVLLQNIIE